MSNYLVHITSNGFVSHTADYDSLLRLRNPQYDTKFGFFQTDLVVSFTAFWSSGSTDYLFYHPGYGKAMAKSLIGLAGLTFNSIALYNTAVGRYNNLLKTPAEKQLVEGFLAGGEVLQLSGRRLSDAAIVWKYLNDSSLFPNEGYYIAGGDEHTVQIKGQIKKGYLFPDN